MLYSPTNCLRIILPSAIETTGSTLHYLCIGGEVGGVSLAEPSPLRHKLLVASAFISGRQCKKVTNRGADFV